MNELMEEVPEGTEIVPAKFIYSYQFMGINHNYLCAICRDKPAVLNCSNGVLNPCHDCMDNGYEIVKITKFGKWFFKFTRMIE